MYKKILKIFLILCAIFLILTGFSQLISKSRLSKYRNSIVNSEVYNYKDINKIFEKSDSEVIYVFLYDSDSEDCIYLDEVLLKQIGYDHNGVMFDDIYKVVYEQSYRSYIQQLIRNTFDVESFPAIVSIKQNSNGIEKVDSFEYSENQNENREELEAFLERNHFFE